MNPMTRAASLVKSHERTQLAMLRDRDAIADAYGAQLHAMAEAVGGRFTVTNRVESRELDDQGRVVTRYQTYTHTNPGHPRHERKRRRISGRAQRQLRARGVV